MAPNSSSAAAASYASLQQDFLPQQAMQIQFNQMRDMMKQMPEDKEKLLQQMSGAARQSWNEYNWPGLRPEAMQQDQSQKSKMDD